MSAVTALVADIASFHKTHGARPRRIRMHPFDVNELQQELASGIEETDFWLKHHAYSSTEVPAEHIGPGYAMSFMGVPVFLAYDAVIARPWLDV